MFIAEGPHSIEAVKADKSDQINIVQLTRNPDCENAVLFINEKVFKLTAFINSLGEPQLRISDVTPPPIPEEEL